MDYTEFERLINIAKTVVSRDKNLRLGQAFFQALEDTDIETANLIRGTERDPYEEDTVEDIFSRIESLIS